MRPFPIPGAIKGLTTAVVLLLAVELLGGQAIDSAWIGWLRDHHQVVRATGDNYDDLQFLKTVLADRRIVQIGESHHSVAEYGTAKTRLIKFLHQEMGFDVLAFESSVYECFAADFQRLSARDALTQSVFGVWASEEVLPLFQYVKDTRATDRPLSFVGFDPQISSATGVRSRPEFFRRVIGAIDRRYADEVALLDSIFIDRIQREGPSYAKSQEETLVAFYERLSAFLETNRDALVAAFPGDASPLIAQRVAWSSIKLVQLLRSYGDNPSDPSMAGHMAIRDGAMADNLTFLARDLYPDRKIIVWAANIHIRHANHQTSWVFPTMGRWLAERFRDELYTIGLYPNRGQTPWGNRNVAFEAAPAGSFERLLADTGPPMLFVDFLGQTLEPGTRWMFETMPARDASITNTPDMLTVPMVPRDQYDGVLFFDQISPPRFLGR